MPAAASSSTGLGNGSVHNVDAITLNLPNRDEKVAEYKAHIRNLGQADIPYTTYAHMANSVWSTPPEQTRGGSRARAFNMARLAEASGGGFTGEGLTHNREYTEDELWDNFASFAQEIAPVAEEAGVRIGIHPDDPPGVPLGGVPRPIFSSFDGYKRALEIADSPNVGMCLCIGCWLEGGEAMGRDVVETIRYFGGQGKIFKVHYRNVDQPLPHFVETFVDDGYFDMYQAMRALAEVELRRHLDPGSHSTDGRRWAVGYGLHTGLHARPAKEGREKKGARHAEQGTGSALSRTRLSQGPPTLRARGSRRASLGDGAGDRTVGTGVHRLGRPLARPLPRRRRPPQHAGGLPCTTRTFTRPLGAASFSTRE